MIAYRNFEEFNVRASLQIVSHAFDGQFIILKKAQNMPLGRNTLSNKAKRKYFVEEEIMKLENFLPTHVSL